MTDQPSRATMTVGTLAMLTAAAVVTSLRGLSMMAEEELTMFAYVGFATLLFLVPAALVAAELGGAFGSSTGGLGRWVREGLGEKWGFIAIWLQWIQNVVWYPTGLAFAAAAAAFAVRSPDLAGKNVYVGVFCIVSYWAATLVALRGTDTFARIAKYGFVAGTIAPGVALVGLAVYWLATGHTAGWDTARDVAVSVHDHPRFFPHFTGLSSVAFLAGILVLFAGIEVQGVHVTEMKNPQRGFPAAMLIAAAISFAIFTLGALAVAAILPYHEITLQAGLFDSFSKVFDDIGGTGFWVPIISALVCYGALGGALAWITGPSKGILATAREGELPPFWQRTNSRGIQHNILLIQGVIVTAISSIYFVMDNVNSAFFLISAMTIALYVIAYLLMYAAAIRLRYTEPDLERAFRVGRSNAWMWIVAGVGFVAVAFALVVSFFPPSQLPIGSPTMYVALVAAGIVVFGGLPLVIHARRKPTWKLVQSAPAPAASSSAP